MVKEDLMARLDKLVRERGKKWKTLAELLHGEGFGNEDGTPFTVDTLRKRYANWLKKHELNDAVEAQNSPNKNSDSPAESIQSGIKRSHTNETMIPVQDLLDLFKNSLERRDAMLAEKLKNDTYDSALNEKIALIEARLEDRLTKTLRDELDGLIVEQVDQALKDMVTPGGSLQRELKAMMSQLLEGQSDNRLISMLDDIHITHNRPPGPGRGRRGSKSKTARFSATMDEQTYNSMKKLAGTFSSHLTAACQLYLRALEAKRLHIK